MDGTSPQRDSKTFGHKIQTKTIQFVVERKTHIGFHQRFLVGWVKMVGYTTMVTLVFLCSAGLISFFWWSSNFFFPRPSPPKIHWQGKWPFRKLQALFRWLLFCPQNRTVLLSKLFKEKCHAMPSSQSPLSSQSIVLCCNSPTVFSRKSAALAHQFFFKKSSSCYI